MTLFPRERESCTERSETSIRDVMQRIGDEGQSSKPRAEPSLLRANTHALTYTQRCVRSVGVEWLQADTSRGRVRANGRGCRKGQISVQQSEPSALCSDGRVLLALVQCFFNSSPGLLCLVKLMRTSNAKNHACALCSNEFFVLFWPSRKKSSYFQSISFFSHQNQDATTKGLAGFLVFRGAERLKHNADLWTF